jgi:hypothetical protein
MRTRDKAGGQRRRLRTLVLGATLVLALCAFTAPAGAAVIGVTQKCFVNSNPAKGAPVSVIGSGFTAGDQVMIFGATTAVSTVAASDGTIAATIPGPVLTTLGAGKQTYTLTAQDETDNVTSASTTVTMANLSVDTVPAVARPDKTVSWHLSGFRPGRTIWVHYFYRRHLVTRMKLGRATGACGMLTSSHPLYPGGHPRHSLYGVVIDQSKRYHKGSRPRITTRLKFGLI